MELIPEKTVERLSLYRRLLLAELATGTTNIFSHQLAQISNTTAAQVRRDIMSIGYTGSSKKGYSIEELIKYIGKTLDADFVQHIAVIGAGNLGKAIIKYFSGKRDKLSISGVFDKDPEKIGKTISGIHCYDIALLDEIIKKENITIAVLTTSADSAPQICDLLVKSGIKAILNFTPVPLKVPDDVYLELMDITITLEKVGYFAKNYAN